MDLRVPARLNSTKMDKSVSFSNPKSKGTDLFLVEKIKPSPFLYISTFIHGKNQII